MSMFSGLMSAETVSWPGILVTSREYSDGLPEQICFRLANNNFVCFDENGVVP